ncbi:TetR/AcrR family transcriptional regulator [Yinghuangia aomiensis]
MSVGAVAQLRRRLVAHARQGRYIAACSAAARRSDARSTGGLVFPARIMVSISANALLGMVPPRRPGGPGTRWVGYVRRVTSDKPAVGGRKAQKPYPKGVARRAQILETALEVFASEGDRKASLRAIADRVGLTDTGVLHYFGSREELFLAVIDGRDQSRPRRRRGPRTRWRRSSARCGTTWGSPAWCGCMWR